QVRLWHEHLDPIRGKFYAQCWSLNVNCSRAREVRGCEVLDIQFLEAVEPARFTLLLYWSIRPAPKEEFSGVIFMMLFPFAESSVRLWLIYNNIKLALQDGN